MKTQFLEQKMEKISDQRSRLKLEYCKIGLVRVNKCDETFEIVN